MSNTDTADEESIAALEATIEEGQADIDAAVVIDFGLRVTKSDLEGHANIAEWHERLQQREAFAQSV